MKISQQTISAVQERINIEDVVSDFISLKKRGQNLIACCPFHDEKTPSFSVSPNKGIYKCFGCGKAGDAISFVMEIEHLEYPEAIRYLAKKYGIEVVEEQQLGQEQLIKQNERESLFIVLNYANEYYQKLLWEKEEGMTIGLSYFKERGFSHQIIKKFELGYSLDKWDDFYNTAINNGHSIDLLEKAGLITKKDEHRVFDRFRGRVMFPIHNVSGKVIAFGARVLKSDQQPKYLNSPETEVYHKSKVLYGIHLAKQAIRQHDNCYLVEGYTDVISLHLSGVENVVASSGTSLTEDQIRLIGRYTENITVLYDGDAAGIKASLRGIDMILEKGLNVKVVVFPDGEDPDSYSRKVGSSDFQNYLKKNATDFITFKVNLFSEEAGNDPTKKAGYIKEIVGTIVKIPDPVTRAVYIQTCSTILEMDESVLISEMNKTLIKNRKDRQKEEKEEDFPLELPLQEKEKIFSSEDIIELQERESIRILLNYGSSNLEEEYHLYHYLLDELEGIEFISPDFKRIFQIFKDELANGKVIDADYLIKNGDEDVKKIVIDLIAEKYEISTNWEERYKIYVPKENENLKGLAYSNVLRLKLRIIRKLMEENMSKIKESEAPEEQEHFLMIHTELKKSEMELAKALGNVVIR